MHCLLEIREDTLIFFQLAMSSKHPREEKNSTEQMVKPSHMRYLYALIRKTIFF
jgi:hypothetical protein